MWLLPSQSRTLARSTSPGRLAAAFSTHAPPQRDLDAKYRYRPPPPPQEYLTSSTVPVTGSIQAVPPPDEDETPVKDVPFVGRKATPLPVMMPLHPAASGPSKRATEIRVAGVVVPPKPSPPESDGRFALWFPCRADVRVGMGRMLHVRLRGTSPHTSHTRHLTSPTRTASTHSTQTTCSNTTNPSHAPSMPSVDPIHRQGNGRTRSARSPRSGGRMMVMRRRRLGGPARAR